MWNRWRKWMQSIFKIKHAACHGFFFLLLFLSIHTHTYKYIEQTNYVEQKIDGLWKFPREHKRRYTTTRLKTKKFFYCCHGRSLKKKANVKKMTLLKFLSEWDKITWCLIYPLIHQKPVRRIHSKRNTINKKTISRKK